MSARKETLLRGKMPKAFFRFAASPKKDQGFTLIELLLVIAIIGILFATVLYISNPGKLFSDQRNDQRRIDVTTIANAISQYALKNNGVMPNSGSFEVNFLYTICGTDDHNDDCDISLSDLTSNNILTNIPIDPKATSDDTGYMIIIDSNGFFTVVSQLAEVGQEILSKGHASLLSDIAYDCHAVSGGNWSDGSTWDGCTGGGGVPNDDDNVQINEGVSVTLDTDVVVSHLKIIGILEVNNYALTLTGFGGVLFNNLGTIAQSGEHKNYFAKLLDTIFSIKKAWATPVCTEQLSVIVENDGDATIFDGDIPCGFSLAILGGNMTTDHTYTISNSALSLSGFDVLSGGSSSVINITAPDLTVSGGINFLTGTDEGIDTVSSDSSDINFTGNALSAADLVVLSGTGNAQTDNSTSSRSGNSGDVNIAGTTLALSGNLAMETGTGSVQITTSNDTSTSTSGDSGDLTIDFSDSISVDGNIAMQSGAGSAHADGSATGNTSTSGRSGDITISSGGHMIVLGSMDLSSGGGTSLTEGTNNTSVGGNSGDITLNISELLRVGPSLNIFSGGGSVTTDGTDLISTGGNSGDITLTIGTELQSYGDNNSINIESNGGSGDGTGATGGNSGDLTLMMDTYVRCSFNSNSSGGDGNNNGMGGSSGAVGWQSNSGTDNVCSS